MALSFSFPRPITTSDKLEDLYTKYGVYRDVVTDLASSSETPETVREGYYGAYLPFFQSCGLIFPIPESVLELIAGLGLAFTYMCHNLLRHRVAFSVRARKEGLSFGLDEFRQFMLVKRNEQSPGTFLISPRPGHHVIENTPYRDDFWREEFIVFKVDRASVGDFDFTRLQRNWVTGIARSVNRVSRIKFEVFYMLSNAVRFNGRFLAWTGFGRRFFFLVVRALLRLSGKLLRRTGTDNSQRSPISLSSGSQGNSASPSRGRAGQPQSDIPDSSHSRSRSRSKRQRVEDVGLAEEGELDLDDELVRLKEMEKDCEGLVTLAKVSDWSSFELDLPQISDGSDGEDREGGSSKDLD
ncbi:hypothetical protein F2Q69_00035796 [Brassica cretica]|uniref:Uncharacterized protein n=1 Tax=Brassica cretica TaxID=69181 RepID=A0A8S9SVE0_BRACR|nr:hypothetical protein F2Q69_00035796 [Brassica cretica]